MLFRSLRDLLVQLRPYGLQGDEEHDIALEEALRELVRQRQSRGDAGPDCKLRVDLQGATLPPRLAVAVYRIAQEALTNALRHAEATQIKIEISLDNAQQQLVLKVADNGKGLPAAAAQASRPRGLGLAGIRERVLANQGVLALLPGEPSGLLLKASFPLC